MEEKKITLGQAIDQILEALEQLDNKSREIAIEAACNKFDIKLLKNDNLENIKNHKNESSVQNTNSTSKITDIRTLKEQKKPTSARQMACLVAYYLQELAPEGERKSTVSTNDIEKYFKQAGYKLPLKLDQLLVDSKSAGYFESSSRGEYKLNAVGYNLVTHTLAGNEE